MILALQNEISAHLLGLPTINAPFTVGGLALMGLLAILACVVWLKQFPYRERIDRSLFWTFGIVLVVFAILRPVGLARDDVAYVEIIKGLCATPDCAQVIPTTRDYVWYYLVKLGLPYHPSSLRIALVLSGLGVLIKLFVIDRLCRQRILALLLFIPLCYLQYDLTQLRAGLAISWMMLGVYWLVQLRPVLGGAALFTNFAVHSQAAFSPGLLAYWLFGWSRWVLPLALLGLLGLLYGGFYPSALALNWWGVVPETSSYFGGMQAGAYAGVKVFPWGYFLMLAYGVWLCSSATIHTRRISEIVAAGLFLGVALAWFFAIIPTMQTRLFEFYAVPLVFLAGNVGSSRLKIAVTILLSLVLYLRLELLNDWILG